MGKSSGIPGLFSMGEARGRALIGEQNPLSCRYLTNRRGIILCIDACNRGSGRDEVQIACH